MRGRRILLREATCGLPSNAFHVAAEMANPASFRPHPSGGKLYGIGQPETLWIVEH
jgi:hypothetical protein